MLDSSPLSSLQRSHGLAQIVLGPNGIVDLKQSGSAKAFIPQNHSTMPEVVFLNTSGGLASDDRLEYRVDLRDGCRAIATTQTAERAYRAKGNPAKVAVRLKVGAGSWLDWLPQETILFNGAKLDRVTQVDLEPGAGCMLLEMIVLGRLAMGETISNLYFNDRREIRQAGRMLHHDALSLDDTGLERLNNAAVLSGARVMATLAVVAPHAPDLLSHARDNLNEPGVVSAVSAPPGRLILRMLATDSWPLRRQINRLLTVLRPDPLPRIWQV